MEYIRSGHYDIVRNDYGRQMVIPSEKEWVEVKRGRWLINKEEGWITIAPCSVCGGVQDIDFPYCPNCGAKMEKE